MPLMYKLEGGYNNFRDTEVEEAEKDGWKIVTEAEWNEIIKAKLLARGKEPVTIAEQPVKVGRPRKGKSIPAFLGGDDGDSTNNH